MPADASALRTALAAWATQVAGAAAAAAVPIMQRDPRVPHDSGELVGSIRADRDVKVAGSRRTVRVRAPVIQARTTDQGARAHPIYPRRPGGLLVFNWPKAGGVVFFRHVHHPGNAAHPWWEAVLHDAWGPALVQAARSTSL